MDSFEELGLGAELVAALASEGAEIPTPFQAAAIPVIRRGNNVLAKAGAGAGTLIAWGAALLDRLEPGAGQPRALVLVHGAESAQGLAEALARLGAATGHHVAAAGSPWVLPERADVLFGTPAELLAWAQAGRVDLKGVDAVVVDQAAAQQRSGALADVEALLAFLPKEGQRIVLALPATPEVESFVERHARRAIQLPAEQTDAAASSGPKRGDVRYRIVEDREAGALQLVSELLEEAQHCCLFFASEDRAADVGDYLTLHGYAAGAPGDADAPVWLAVNELEARGALPMAGLVPVSYDAPAGPDALDRRHGGGRGGVILVLPREVPHMRDTARRTGYKVVPFPPRGAADAARGELAALLARLDATAGEMDLAPWLIALEPLLEKRGAAEVAAAAIALLRERAGAEVASGPSAVPEARAKKTSAKPAAPTAKKPAAPEVPRGPAAMTRLYISIGERDGAGPRDLMGAITGEANIKGSQIGKIEVRDTFSIVEVEEPVAEKVIKSLNGITVRGRSVRADFDRGPGRDRGEGAGRVERAGARRKTRDSGEKRGPREEPPKRGARGAPRGERRDRGDDARPARGPRRDRDDARPARGDRGGDARPQGGARSADDRPTRRPRDDESRPSRGGARGGSGGGPRRGSGGARGGSGGGPRGGSGGARGGDKRGKAPRGPGGKPPARRGPRRDDT